MYLVAAGANTAGFLPHHSIVLLAQEKEQTGPSSHRLISPLTAQPFSLAASEPLMNECGSTEDAVAGWERNRAIKQDA